MDIEHYFTETGNGEPLILLHGNGEDCGYFRGQIEEFSNRYHVYAIDTRGHGRTPRGDKPFTIRQFAEDLLGFMDAHQIYRAHLLGFSDGGNIAMIFAIQYPDRVNRLILNGAKEPEELAKIKAKTLVIAGTKDMIKKEHTRLIASHIPDSELVFLKGNHFIANKHPDEFNRAVLQFLRS